MNKSDITRDYCMLEGALEKRDMIGGGIHSQLITVRPDGPEHFT